ncbi:unnamed protein product [Taenia asiatica]|uniref:MMS1_N domain-containing protein n=1 Tax=Taenia asiatica TaxID=60517 RepID=A0A0R3WA04_TAEAS|nr:unnamed protein product [Taenia asiatica]
MNSGLLDFLARQNAGLNSLALQHVCNVSMADSSESNAAQHLGHKIAIGVPDGFDLHQDKGTVSGKWCLGLFPGGHSVDNPCPSEDCAITDVLHLEGVDLSAKVVSSINSFQRCDSAIPVIALICADFAINIEAYRLQRGGSGGIGSASGGGGTSMTLTHLKMVMECAFDEGCDDFEHASLGRCISDVSDDLLTAVADTVTLRRLVPVKDIGSLIIHEKSLIMEVSNDPTGMHSSAEAATTGKWTKYSSIGGTSVCVVGLVTHDLSVVLTAYYVRCAGQRRQALLEELGVLHKGSLVLVSPMRGEPLRARLQLYAVQLVSDGGGGGGSGSGGGGGGEYLVVGMGERLRTVDGRRPLKYHILAALKDDPAASLLHRCVGEGMIKHIQTVALPRVNDPTSSVVGGAPFVDLVAAITVSVLTSIPTVSLVHHTVHPLVDGFLANLESVAVCSQTVADHYIFISLQVCQRRC